ncbi:hypothetical protein J4206_02290 [Candidatus Woesearchaeota archaeon]|nr:hypothetical protein [Candidatus Woesearchaeota archaeon]
MVKCINYTISAALIAAVLGGGCNDIPTALENTTDNAIAKRSDLTVRQKAIGKVHNLDFVVSEDSGSDYGIYVAFGADKFDERKVRLEFTPDYAGLKLPDGKVIKLDDASHLTLKPYMHN